MAPIHVKDLSGEARAIPDPHGKATVLIFITTDCPISNSYVPEINRIYAQYSPRDVAFYIVYADPTVSRDEMRRHSRDYRLQPDTLADESHLLAKRVGATITPEAVILAPDGERLYRGRIDNVYAALGKRRDQPTERDLRDALDAILSGKPVAKPATEAIGCFITFDP